jgi:hypothetical protein
MLRTQIVLKGKDSELLYMLKEKLRKPGEKPLSFSEVVSRCMAITNNLAKRKEKKS